MKNPKKSENEESMDGRGWEDDNGKYKIAGHMSTS